MIDAHVHLEKGPYTREWVEEFLRYAQQRGIEEVYFLEHTHLFTEYLGLYDEMASYNPYQYQWFEKKRKNAKPIGEYLEFIRRMKEESWPVKIKFGLEVCYSPEHEEEIRQLKDRYPMDFWAGSVHFLDGWAFSHLRQPWKKDEVRVKELYARYYDLLARLAESRLFSGLSHPNSLQCFGTYPPEGMEQEARRLAAALRDSRMYVEESSGLRINYGDPELGMSSVLLHAMIRQQVPVLTASDAHIPENVGKWVREMCEAIAQEEESFQKGLWE